VLALLVIETEPGADAGPGLGDAGIGIEVDLLLFEAFRKPDLDGFSFSRWS